MMKKLLTNAKILDKKINKFKDVNILINDNIIEKIFEINEKEAKSDDFLLENEQFEKIDCKNNIIIYGFINSNSYLIKSFFESFVCNVSLEKFEENYVQFLSKLSLEDKYVIYKFQILNLIKNGITTFCDDDFFSLALKKAVKETNINVVYKLGYTNCFDEFDKKNIEKLSKENQDFVFSLNSVLNNSEENFQDIISTSKKFNKPIFIYGSGNLFEAGSVEANFNKTATQLFEDFGLLDVNHAIINNNVLDKEDFDLLGAYNSKLIFSPSFNLTFANKNANIYALEKTNLIGLSSFKNNFDLEMFLTNNVENENYNKIEIFSPTKLYEFATKNNAEILGLDNQGEIKEGCIANLLTIQNDNLFNDANLFFKNFKTNMINSVFVKGKIVYASNHFVLNNDYEHLKQQCLNIIKKLS